MREKRVHGSDLDAVAAAMTAQRGGFDVVAPIGGQWKVGKPLHDPFRVSGAVETLQQFLKHEAGGDDRLTLSEKTTELIDEGGWPGDDPAGRRGTTHWYRPGCSMARALRLVVERLVPLELAEEFQKPPLPSPVDEFPQRERDRGFFAALTAYRKSVIDKVGVELKIGGHV